MVDVSSQGDARGRPRDAPVALELDERPLVPVHLQQHRVPDPHRGRGLDARERGRRWRAGKSAQFRHVRRRIGGGIGTRARGAGGVAFREWHAAGRRGRRGRGTADGARRTTTFSLGRSRPVSPSVIRTGHVSFCRAFQKARAAVPPLDVRASRRDAPAVRPLRPRPRPERARDRAAKRRARRRKRRRAVSEGGGGEGWGGGGPFETGLADARRAAPPPPDPTPRQLGRARGAPGDGARGSSAPGRGRVGERYS